MKTLLGLFSLLIWIPLILVGTQPQAKADDADEHIALYASNSIGPLLAAGEVSLLLGGSDGKSHAIQGAKAVVATCLITEGLKLTVREERPNSESTSSFPSGHTSAAFAMATVIGDFHPRYRTLAYGAATLIGWSRVERGAHHVQDVVAGALLGHYVARHFTNEHIVATGNGLGLQWKW